MTDNTKKAIIKAAKKYLKKKTSGEQQLKDVAAAVAKKQESDESVDVLAVLRASSKFKVNDDGTIQLKKKTDKKKKRSREESTKENSSESSKRKKTTTDLTGKSQDTSSIAAWRKENQIVVSEEHANHEITQPLVSFTGATDLNSILLKHCTETLGFSKPSPIQAQSWPILTAHRDLVGIAETGSGKTLAFGLPALSFLANGGSEKKQRDIRFLVLAPTRELALQSAEVLTEFGALVDLRCLTIYGGVPKHTQLSALQRRNIDIVVATPGRLKDLVEAGACRLEHVKVLVLDEADRMLDMGFEEDVRSIVSQTSKEGRQTAMFSATWPVSIQSIASEFLQTDAIRVKVGVHLDDNSLAANPRVKQNILVLEDRERESKLRELLSKLPTDSERILIFALYKKEAERLERTVRDRMGYNCGSIHGNKQQAARTAALDAFKTGRVKILVATDVAARGLDIPDVGAVINYTFPLTIEDYVHRIGRTGRAGAKGLAYTFFQPIDKSHAGELQQVLRQVGQAIPDELAKFGNTIKKKEHKLYGNFGPKAGPMKKATKITFDDDE